MPTIKKLRKPNRRRFLASDGAPKKPRKKEELEFHFAAAAFFDWALPPSVRWLHIPNGEYRHPATGARLKKMGVKKGALEINLFYQSRVLIFEFKSSTGKLTKEQADWQQWFLNNGFACYICRTLEQIEAALIEQKIPFRARIK